MSKPGPLSRPHGPLACVLVVAGALALLLLDTGVAGAAEPAGPANDASPFAMGANLGVLTDYTPQWFYVNVMRQARPWFVEPNVDGDEIWAVDGVAIPSRPDGYPLQVPFVHRGREYRVHTLLLRELEYPALTPQGEYGVSFAGTGRIRLDFDAARTELAEGGAVYRIPVTPSEEGISVTILESDPADPVHDIRVVFPGFDPVEDADAFYPPMVAIARRFPVLRYMWAMLAVDPEFSLTSWTEVAPPDYYTTGEVRSGGIPPAEIARFSNATDSDPWVTIPHAANDEYVRELAMMLHDRLDASRTVYVEYGNELWNTAPHYYPGYRTVQDRGQALGFGEEGEAGYRYTVRRSLEIFRIFEAVFGGSDRLVRIIPSFAAIPRVAEVMVAALQDDVINPWGGEADALAIAPYFGGEFPDSLAREYGGPRFSVDTILEQVSRLAFDGESNADVDTTDFMVRENARIAREAGLELIAYEGGQHIVSQEHVWNPEMRRILNEANRDPRMEELYRRYFEIWERYGGGLFLHYDLVGAYTRWGSWGLVEHLHHDYLAAPKWRAIESYLREE